jgi:hypothetical protein
MRRGLSVVLVLGLLSLAGCISLVGGYDPSADQILNQMSEDTAKFLAAAEAGKKARSASSDEAVAYYAGAYDALDRLTQRAAVRRGGVPCLANANLPALLSQPKSLTELPAEYPRFDCRETQLYVLRFTLDQVKVAQDADGVLSAADVEIYGGQLRAEILVAIKIAIETKL